VAIWAITSVASTEWQYFWPIWVAGPWGAVLLWQTIVGLSGGEPQRRAEKRDRKALAEQRKRQRDALGPVDPDADDGRRAVS
jgi:hypothetical protein